MNLQKSIIELVKHFYNNTVKLWLDVCILDFGLKDQQTPKWNRKQFSFICDTFCA